MTVDIYLDDFISPIQGGAKERTQLLRNLFHTINHLFRPNGPADVNHKDPIPLKKLWKGDTAWSTRETILGWYLNMDSKLLHFPSARAAKLCDALSAIPSSTHI